MSFPNDTQIFLAAGRLYHAHAFLPPLQRMFPRLTNRTALAAPEDARAIEGQPLLAQAVDYLVCLQVREAHALSRNPGVLRVTPTREALDCFCASVQPSSLAVLLPLVPLGLGAQGPWTLGPLRPHSSQQVC